MNRIKISGNIFGSQITERFLDFSSESFFPSLLHILHVTVGNFPPYILPIPNSYIVEIYVIRALIFPADNDFILINCAAWTGGKSRFLTRVTFGDRDKEFKTSFNINFCAFAYIANAYYEQLY